MLRRTVLGLSILLSLTACGDDGAADGSAAAGANAGSGLAGAGTAGAGAAAGTLAQAGTGAGAGVAGTAPVAGVQAEAGTGSAVQDVPAADATSIGAFLAAEAYRQPPWISETDAPRAPEPVSPHARVRVWFNATLVASFAKVNGVDLDAAPHDTNSMAVKEFYDDGETRLGWAAMLKLDGDRTQWAYYCDGPAEQCNDNEPIPVFGIASGPTCTFCHGGLVFTQPP